MFSNRGRLYIKKCYEIPEAGRTSKGTNLVNVLSLEPDEEITAICRWPNSPPTNIW